MQGATAKLLAGIAGLKAVLPLGDQQYGCGELSNYAASYAKSWGKFKAIEHPGRGQSRVRRLVGLHSVRRVRLLLVLRCGRRRCRAGVLLLRHRDLAPDCAQLELQVRARRV